MEEIERFDAEETDEPVKAPGKEIKIFKEPQEAEVTNDAGQQVDFSFFFVRRIEYFLTDGKIHGGGNPDKGEEPPVPISVEEVAADQEEGGSEPVGQCVIGGYYGGQEEEEDE